MDFGYKLDGQIKKINKLDGQRVFSRQWLELKGSFTPAVQITVCVIPSD